jgi:hypothetical protein
MSLNFAVWSPFYQDLSLSSGHAREVLSGKNGSQLAGSRVISTQSYRSYPT